LSPSSPSARTKLRFRKKENTMSEKKARALGINHVVLEVGDLDKALEFYGAIFDFKLRGKSDHNAFIDMGDQFIQLSLGKTQGPDDKRHFGFVVDDREPVRGALEKLGLKSINERLNFRDPWGNRIEVVSYDDIQFTKASHVLKGLGVGDLQKTPNAIEELRKKGMAPEA
jgi:lactoylglutathione lyase